MCERFPLCLDYIISSCLVNCIVISFIKDLKRAVKQAKDRVMIVNFTGVLFLILGGNAKRPCLQISLGNFDFCFCESGPKV